MDLIPKVIYINIDKRIDRKNRLLGELKRIGIPETKIIRQPGITTETDTSVGCGLSHIEAVKTAKELNLPFVLILEDDCFFAEDTNQIQKQMKHFFDTMEQDNIEWNGVTLSWTNILTKDYKNDEILNICVKTTNAVAYILHSRIYDDFIDTLLYGANNLRITGKHWIYMNDIVWHKFMTTDKWYSFKQPIADQYPGINSISNVFTNHARIPYKHVL